jgi:hypothetical protein
MTEHLPQLNKTPILARYDAHKETGVAADASSFGLGAVLAQRHGKHWRLVHSASHLLRDAERRYAQIEKEALAATWACGRFHLYLFGCPSLHSVLTTNLWFLYWGGDEAD